MVFQIFWSNMLNIIMIFHNILLQQYYTHILQIHQNIGLCVLLYITLMALDEMVVGKDRSRKLSRILIFMSKRIHEVKETVG